MFKYHLNKQLHLFLQCDNEQKKEEISVPNSKQKSSAHAEEPG